MGWPGLTHEHETSHAFAPAAKEDVTVTYKVNHNVNTIAYGIKELKTNLKTVKAILFP